MSATTRAVEEQVNEVARHAAPWIEALARAGYFSRGVVYVLVAGLAARAAFEHQRPAATRGALRSLLAWPLGRALLPLVALGLLGYAVWCLVEAVLDPEGRGWSPKGAGKRVGLLFTTCVYVGMAWTALRLFLGARQPGDRFSAEQWTRPVMEHPLGRWAVAATGVGIAIYGLWLVYRALAKEPEKRLETSRLSPRALRIFRVAGKIGIGGRAAVFEVIGIWLVRAALHYRPAEARMPAGALEEMREQPHGRWILAGVAVGLAAFGLFEMVKARYRHIPRVD